MFDVWGIADHLPHISTPLAQCMAVRHTTCLPADYPIHTFRVACNLLKLLFSELPNDLVFPLLSVHTNDATIQEAVTGLWHAVGFLSGRGPGYLWESHTWSVLTKV